MRRLFLILSLLLPVTLLVSSASLAETKLEASIFSYDGKDFVRTETTLMQGGQSAVGTKLDHDSPAYKALAEKHSYTGPATVFGQNYQANYAPLMGADGKLTGALFVGVPEIVVLDSCAQPISGNDFRDGAGRVQCTEVALEVGGLRAASFTFAAVHRMSALGH